MKAALTLLATVGLLFILLSPASAQDVQLPAQPTGLTASPTSEAVTLGWDGPGDDSITAYQVLRRSRDGDAYGDDKGAPEFAVIADDTGSAETQYRDSSVTPRARYVYRIKARNAAGLSPWSSYANAETLTAPAIQAKDAVARSDASTCPDSTPPTPTAVPIDAIPIVVSSTTAEYFVLYVSHVIDADTTVEIPVAVTRGAAGTTTLSENVAALPRERYRVEKYMVSNPADVDGDCIDDITELTNLGSMNPVNPPAAIDSSNGALAIPDQATFESLAKRRFLKFVVFDIDSDRPGIYFQNTKTYNGHGAFLASVGLEGVREGMRTGTIAYDPELIAPNGIPGVYYYSVRAQFHPQYTFKPAEVFYSLLAASVPLLKDNLALHVRNQDLLYVQSDLPLLRESRMPLVFDEDIYADTNFMALNPGEGYGLLRAMNLDERPNSRDVVIYEALPNELPRVAGIITTVPQAPLSHVNLRAVQDGAPNAFIRNALDDGDDIAALVGSYVHYTVTKYRYTIRAATRTEVDDHHASSRPTLPQTPQRDLSVTAITPLSEIAFDDWNAFGVKAANVAQLRKLGLPSGTVPDGFAIPFYFYDEFMKHNDFYTRIRAMLADSNFQGDINNAQEIQLKALRDAIEEAETPQWIIDALVQMNEGFPSGINRRYRSSTNNEDLPGFNGAGLYDSKSQKPSEDEKDLAKSLKEVYASLWNLHAFIERDFHRVDHLKTAMGILVHPSYRDELVNGVAVSFDPVTGRDGSYYVNSQVGEDLVTNPDAHSVPEEVLLRGPNSYRILRTSNQLPAGQLLMTEAQLQQLRRHLGVIHTRFKVLYKPAPREPFAMEIEFKITSDNVLAIKQARPWVFGSASTVVEPVPPPVVTVSFAAGSYTVAEGESVSVVVSLNADPGRTLAIPLTTANQNGAASADYSGVPANVMFASGETSKAFVFSATEDTDDDGGESVAIGFGTLPTGVTAGGTNDTVVTITMGETTPSPPIVLGGGGGGGGGGPSGPTPSDIEFEWNVTRDIEELDSGHSRPTGLWSNGATLWLAENGDGAADAVYPYDLASGERVEEREFELDDGNLAPRGLWSDRATMWVSDSGQEKLFAHDLATGERLPDSDLVLHPDNDDPRGIWSDGATMWVLDGTADALFGYDLASGELLGEYALDSTNDDLHGVWSDGVTVWVSNHDPKRLFAYRLPMPGGLAAEDAAAIPLERVRDEEFTELRRAGNNSPRGLWSDGDVMYVADASDGKVYSYNMPDAIDARLASLTLSGVDIGEFSSSQTEYEGTPDESATQTTVMAAAMQQGADVAIDPTDAAEEADGHQIALQDLAEISVTVTSADGTREKTYRVSFPEVAWDPARDPWPYCLRGAVAEGFSLVVFKGGSVEELVACAESRDIVALYTLHEGIYISYILRSAGLRQPRVQRAVRRRASGHDAADGGERWAALGGPVRG